MRLVSFRLLTVCALALAVAGCSDDDDDKPNNPGGGGALNFVGTVNGVDGILSGSVTFSITGTTVTGTFEVISPTPATHALTGTYEVTTKILSATGGGYTFGGEYDGVNRLEGGVVGTAMGTFVTVKDDGSSAVAFCGTFSGADSGVWNFTIDGSTVIGSYTTTSGSVGALDGTISGNAITLSEGGTPLATGTRSGDDASGTWDAGGGNSGTWTGSRCN